MGSVQTVTYAKMQPVYPKPNIIFIRNTGELQIHIAQMITNQSAEEIFLFNMLRK